MPKVFATMSSIILAGLALMMPAPAHASLHWLPMSRHGECTEVDALERKVPDLGDIRDPHAFTNLMRQEGYEVLSAPYPVPEGKAQEVNIPGKGLLLSFVTPKTCHETGRRQAPQIKLIPRLGRQTMNIAII